MSTIKSIKLLLLLLLWLDLSGQHTVLYIIYDRDDGAIFAEKPLITTKQCTWFFLSKMASVVGCLLVIGFFQGSVLGEQQQNTLNVPQVLLPYAPRGSVHTNFTLKALQGCYLW